MDQSMIASRFYADTFAGGYDPWRLHCLDHPECCAIDVGEDVSYRTPFRDADVRQAEAIFDQIIAARKQR